MDSYFVIEELMNPDNFTKAYSAQAFYTFNFVKIMSSNFSLVISLELGTSIVYKMLHMLQKFQSNK